MNKKLEELIESVQVTGQEFANSVEYIDLHYVVRIEDVRLIMEKYAEFMVNAAIDRYILQHNLNTTQSHRIIRVN